ncbi:MAG: Threonine dehydrogenase and related Zn-dependent dehydrogenases, partial [uncultured Nocardioides sp.]
ASHHDPRARRHPLRGGSRSPDRGADGRDRQGRRRLHLRLGPVALPGAQRHRPGIHDRPRVRGRRGGGRVGRARHPDRRLRHRPVRPLRQHLCPLPGRRPLGVRRAGLHRERAGGVLAGHAGRRQPGRDRRDAGRRPHPVAAHALRRDGHRLARRRRCRRTARRHRGRRGRRRGRSVRGAGGRPARRRARDRDVAPRAAPGARPPVRGHRHRRRAWQGGGGAGRRAHRRGRRGRRPGVRGHRPGDEDRVRGGPARVDRRFRGRAPRRGAPRPPDVPAQRRARRRHGAGAPLPARAARPGHLRHHRAGPRLRPHAADGAVARGLPRHGRASRDQGAAPAV